MDIKAPQEVQSIERVATPTNAGNATQPAQVKRDRVTVDSSESQRAALISSAASQAGATRAARLAELASQIKSGNYHPTAAELADQLLNAAEIDARLQAMLKG